MFHKIPSELQNTILSTVLAIKPANFQFSILILYNNKNTSGDEIANVNLFTTISHTYFKIPKNSTYFV